MIEYYAEINTESYTMKIMEREIVIRHIFDASDSACRLIPFNNYFEVGNIARAFFHALHLLREAPTYNAERIFQVMNVDFLQNVRY